MIVASGKVISLVGTGMEVYGDYSEGKNEQATAKLLIFVGSELIGEAAEIGLKNAVKGTDLLPYNELDKAAGSAVDKALSNTAEILVETVDSGGSSGSGSNAGTPSNKPSSTKKQ